jgi:hypothetical protein
MVVGAVPATAEGGDGGADGAQGTRIGTAYSWKPAAGSPEAKRLSAASRQWYEDHPYDDVPGNWPGRWTGWPGKHPGARGVPTAPTTEPPAESPTDPGPTATVDPPIVTHSAEPTEVAEPTEPTEATTPAPSSSITSPSTTPTTPTKVTSGKALIPNRSGLPWASGVYVPANNPAGIEKFAAWRGRKVDVAVTWSARQTWDDIINPSWMYDTWKGSPYTMAFGVAPVPEADGSATMAGCANGDYNSKWATFGTNLKNAGLEKSILRLGWEFNGNWYKWRATDPAQFARCYQQIVTSIRTTASGVIMDWTVNRGASQALSDPTQAYPGDKYVDIVGIDSYDMWPGATSEAAWQDQYAGAYGLKFWADFAKSHGKKVSVPEWGCYPGTAAAGHNGGDNAFYIGKMEAFFAGQGSNLAYESYFNEDAGYYGGAIFGPTQNPNAAAKYKAAIAGS